MKSRKITINGEVYSSYREAKQKTGITTISHRLKKGFSLTDKRNLHLRKIEVDGNVFASVADACSFYNLSYSLVSARLNHQKWTANEAFEIEGRPDNLRRGGIVYLISNRETRKSYVGITFRTKEERWLEHVAESIQNSTSKYSLQAAIKKYGMKSFDVVVLHERCGAKLLERLEQEEIVKRNTMVPNGYNLIRGGGGISSSGKAIEVDGVKFKSIAAACAVLRKNTKTVTNRLQRLGWTIEESFDLASRVKHPVIVVNGIKYDSLIKAHKMLKPTITRQAIWYRLQRGLTPEQAFGIRE